MSASLRIGAWTFVATARVDGNLAPGASGAGERRSALAGGRPVIGPRQVHGTTVLVVDQDHRSSAGATDLRTGTLDPGADLVADALVSTRPGLALCVVTADCSSIGLVAGPVGAVVHAGWRGLAAGIIDEAVARVRSLAEPDDVLHAVVGPCIHPSSYAFGDDGLAELAAQFGPTVRATTSTGAPALDLPTAVRINLGRLGATVADALLADTADPAFFSHRVRGDRERQAMLAWRHA